MRESWVLSARSSSSSRNCDSAGAPKRLNMHHSTGIGLFASAGVPAGGIDWNRELRNIGALKGYDLTDALFLDFIDAQHRMHGQIGALYFVEFRLYLLLSGVHHHR